MGHHLERICVCVCVCVTQIKKMWKEESMAYFKILSHHFNGMTEENHETNQIKIGSVQSDIQTQDFTNTKQES
jgi:hypothetical protein